MEITPTLGFAICNAIIQRQLSIPFASSGCPTLVAVYMQLTHERMTALIRCTAGIVLTLWNAQNERSKWICTISSSGNMLVYVIRAGTSRASSLEKEGSPCHRSTSGCWTADFPGSCMLLTHVSQHTKINTSFVIRLWKIKCRAHHGMPLQNEEKRRPGKAHGRCQRSVQRCRLWVDAGAVAGQLLTKCILRHVYLNVQQVRALQHCRVHIH